MLNNARSRKILMNFRIANMQCVKHALLRYKETGDESWYILAKEFGEWSLSFKKQIDQLK